ncbi:Zn-dependent hydrolase, glyoxylase [Cellulomonas flavigena DSM 20109]|uniref:Zn-dependent hydrolase, glyoxylase n=1 Tax=Cellulomonas flavigena (strain ATCC 482 / DSM 20109 / BCRC 11376 / JCM 18109 / NBRC 3775 / NCIMB 8073 / NRS 134) TaxID=446466 RepID=D5UF49_CELFN|nr:MBL fold metallo-hydrolase [Cellulomonas flavigena]ADG74846.1 Zn-dependent hydrolase, glyoxylase [Cellulomonas flavigena DSM 20109]
MDAERYTGHVEPGGSTAVRVLDDAEVRKVSVGPMDNAAYLVTCRRSGAQVLVDAPADPDRLLALLREGSATARLDLVVVTHRHRDHLGALASVVAVTGAAVAAGADDADAVATASDHPVDRRLRHGDVLTVGHLRLDVVALRGHTPGSVALALTEPSGTAGPDAAPGRVHLFTGDSLFPGGVGNTDRDPQRFAQLLGDVTERVFARYGDDTWVYPGHGDDTTLGIERPALPAWAARGW